MGNVHRQKIHNISFLLACSFFLLSFLIFLTCANLLHICEWPTRSGLEQRALTKEATLAKSSFTEGDFQDKIETYIADHVPYRAENMLLNASLQRAGIVAMANVLGYDAYPSFFGSDYIIYPQQGVIVPNNVRKPTSKANKKALRRFVNTFNRSAREHPDVNFYIDQVCHIQQSDSNPSYDMRNHDDLFDEDWAQKKIIDKLDPRITARIDRIDGFDAYCETFFHSDLHWTLERGLATYNVIADTLNLSHVVWNDEKAVCVTDRFYGNNARGSLDLDYPSVILDMPDDFSNLEYYELSDEGIGEKMTTERMRDVVLSGQDVDIPPYSAYTWYFEGDNCYIANTDAGNNGKTCLLIGDSYSRNIYRYIADNYASTVIVLPGNIESGKPLDWYIETFDADDVIVVTHAQKYMAIVKTSPDFLDPASKK